MTINTQGMTEITLTNSETGEQVTYTVADIQCAKMLAAEDHGGEPDEWLTAEEIRDQEAWTRRNHPNPLPGAAMNTTCVASPAQLREAAQHLAKSDKGRDALRHVLDWLEESGLSLDHCNQDAILTLLDGAWGGYAGTVREVMHESLGDYLERQPPARSRQ